MRFSVQRFPIMSASICHTPLGHGEIKGRWAKKKKADAGLTSLLRSGASDAFLLAHPRLFFFVFFLLSPIPYIRQGPRGADGKAGRKVLSSL